jgi:Fe-S cluster biogenesis protein NfuA/nitrite reductase/ring-hydroxylating ferredoxin subunit
MEARRMTGVQKVSARVEELLDALKAGGFGGAASAAEELVTLLVGLYGDGLARVMTVLAESGPQGEAMIAKLADDPFVESLLLLHDLHPLGVDARIQRALDRVRPYLGSHAGGVQYLGVTGGIARLRLEGSCNGCPSSTVTVQLAITSAVQDAAPEVTEVVVEGVTAPPGPKLLQIGPPPQGQAAIGSRQGNEGLGLTQAGAGSGGLSGGSPPTVTVWITLPDIGPPSSRPVIASADGLTVVVCAVRGTLYAYRDSCARCASSLADGQLNREELSCPACGTRYNVRLAGKGVDDAALHLDPLPLLADSQGVRVAVPEAVR